MVKKCTVETDIDWWVGEKRSNLRNYIYSIERDTYPSK